LGWKSGESKANNGKSWRIGCGRNFGNRHRL
jgi:hypothetical protein